MKTRRRISLVAGAVSPLILFISVVGLSSAGGGLLTSASHPESEEEDTFEFTNNEAEDAYDLHIHWSRAVTVKQVKPFKKKEGSGTSRTDFSNGVVKKGGKASVTVSWDGSTDAKVEEWWWTKKNGDLLGEEKKGNPTAAGAPTGSPSGAAKASIATANGLHTITFDTLNGRVLVNLPDDMRAGDTISGTVVAEPKGKTAEERKANGAELSELKLNLGSRFPQDKTELMIFITPRVIIQDEESPGAESSNRTNFTTKLPESFDYTIGVNAPRTDTETVTITINSPIWFINNQPTTPPRTESPSSASPFRIPEMGQQGRPFQIIFPNQILDAAPILMYGPVGSSPADFEKNVENVSGGFGLIGTLARSPRGAIFQSPTNVSGPMELYFKSGAVRTTAPYRNVGVNLTAPKTNLTRGERTTATIEVRGLEGIKKDVPLQLESKGVITMEGGNFQNLRIKPNEVQKDGRYTTTRGITGVQAGGFTVTATVIVRRFDFTLQDDSDPNRIFYFNSFTGDYIFACGGGSCSKPGGAGGTTQTGGATGKTGGTPVPPVPPGGLNLTGVGRPTMRGCIITLSHNAPDRRVFARLDACTKTGEANVQTTSPKTEVNITDKNTADNTAPSPPPK